MKRYSNLAIVSAALLLLVTACAKTTDSSASASTAPAASPAAMATQGGTMATNGAAASDGARVFQTNCSSCHQAQGEGVPGTFPPLAGNAVVVGDATKVIHIVKYGLNGKLSVKGQAYNGMMPAWGQQLSNADIASVVTFVRSAWGNKASAVTEAQVKAVAQ